MEYFTPLPIELHEFYECEFDASMGKGKPDWKKVRHSILEELDALKYMRTPYLTADQIFSEGWLDSPIAELTRENDLGTIQGTILNGNSVRGRCEYHLIYVPKSRHLLLSVRYPGGYPQTIYAGDCKSVNELRKICQWVGIKSE
jgi:hypothetical protein